MRIYLVSLKCSRDLAIKLGAIEPVSVKHFTAMRESGVHIECRDPTTLEPLFWPCVQGVFLPRESS